MMSKYMAVHYDGVNTSFIPAATVEAAHAHLKQLLGSGPRKTNHTVTIVELNDDRVLYFKNTGSTFGNLTNADFSIAGIRQFIGQSVHRAVGQLAALFTNR